MTMPDHQKFGAGHSLLFVINDPAFWLSHRKNLGIAAREAGFSVTIAAPEDVGRKEIEELGFGFISLQSLSRWKMNPLTELQSIAELSRVYRTLKPDIVHHVTIKPVLYGSIAARISNTPAVVNSVSGLGHVFLSHGLKATLRRALVHIAYGFAAQHQRQCMIFQNRSDLELFTSRGLVPRKDTILIPGSGVSGDLFTATQEPSGEPVVLLPARFLVDKGLREFAGAAKILKSEGVKARFVLIGDSALGNPAAVPKEEIDAWCNEGFIEAHPYSTDMPRIFSRSHIICLPSYREGFSKALIEALASARPIVTTKVPGCADAVVEGVNGLLVPPRDIQALASALRLLIAEPALRREMGGASRILFKEMQVDEGAIVKRIMRIYEEML